MIVRRCAGGVVFYANKVLLLKNDRHENTKLDIFSLHLAWDDCM